MIDEVHTLIGAGAAEGAIDAANILKPALARGELQCMGATTLDEYRKHIEKDPALERRFQPVRVNEPTVEETYQILGGGTFTLFAWRLISAPLGCCGNQAGCFRHMTLLDPDSCVIIVSSNSRLRNFASLNLATEHVCHMLIVS
jgi:hypothetical protein